MEKSITKEFLNLVDEIPHIGFKRNAALLFNYVKANQPYIKKSIKDLPALTGPKAESAIVISAGPSIHKRKTIQTIAESGYEGTIVAVDASYIACIKAGIIPDYLVSLDPYPTRVLRWFGDPDFEKNTAEDDYFARQDLDVEFRENTIKHNLENIKLVDKMAYQTKVALASSSATDVVKRLDAARFDLYWWNPLVDDPTSPESLTKKFYEQNKLPCMNTGGNVGTAAWIFAATRLGIKNVALTGMDFGYYHTTPWEQTQTYYELLDKIDLDQDALKKYFVEFTFPLTKEKFYTDPTYFWYRKNFLEMLPNVKGSRTFNCTEGGTIVDPSVECLSLKEFIFMFYN